MLVSNLQRGAMIGRLVLKLRATGRRVIEFV